MLVGHSLLLLLSSACGSFLGTGMLDDPHRFSFFSGSRYGIAISSFHCFLLAYGRALLPFTSGVRHSTVVVRTVFSFHRICAREDLTMVQSSPYSHVRDVILMRAQLKQLESTFDPLVNTCVPTEIHRGLVNALAVLVADTVLLLAMLIGLLRHANRRSAGLWKLLYQQVSSNRSASHDSNADLLQCIIWIALATLAEIPPVVSAFLPFY